MFAIFILKNGAWAQHTRIEATADNEFFKQELSYLNDTLGVVARVFKKL